MIEALSSKVEGDYLMIVAAEKIACVARDDMSAFSDFWVDVAQRSGYDHHGFSSIELAREFLSK